MIRPEITVTVEGVPLETVIEKQESDEIRTCLDQSLAEMGKCRFKGTVAPKFNGARFGPAGPAKVLTDDEIRKEMGVMARPLPTITENMLWVLQNKGPITVGELANEVKGKRNSVSSMASRLIRYFRDTGEIIVGDTKPITMSLAPGVNVHELSRRFHNKEYGIAKARQVGEAPVEEPAPAPVEAQAVSLQQLVDTIKQLNVVFSGKIEVVFRIEVPK